MENIHTVIYQKGKHFLEVIEMGEEAKINGFKGWLDNIELMSLLLNNGYVIIG